MPTQNTYRTLVAYLFACMIFIFVAGCGGGSDDPAVTTESSPFTENFIDIAAVSGPIVAVRVGQMAVLDDSRSFADSAQALNYSWSFSHKPKDSNAVLQGATTASPSFIADVSGVYMVQLVVSAEGITSQRAITTVVVTNPGERLTGRFNHPGLSSNCVNCHNGVNTRVNGQVLFPKTPDHIASSNACQTCHTPQDFNIIPFVDHQEVFGNCSECHNGVIAVGKSEFHPATEVECDECHNTSHFLELAPDGSFDHSNITRTCSGCHNGAVATGKTPTTADTPPGTHPVTNIECGYCHTTINFLDAYPDHTDPAVVGAGCDSCHAADGNGSAQGQSNGHPVTNVDCATCHSVVTFKMPGGIFNHSVVDPTVQSCESCHNDNNSINAPGKGSAVPTHPVTSADCGSCHSTETFNPAFGVDHTDPAVLAARCDSCHGVTASGKPISTPFYEHMPTSEDCSACHTPGTFSTGTFDHTGPSFVGSCDSCHNNVIGVGKLPNHIPTTPDNQDCADCHTTLDFADVTFSHVGITNNCESCHDGSISIGKSFNHLPTNQDCIVCHSTAALFKPASNFAHVGITDNCETCHDGSSNNAAAGAIGKIANHIPAQNECSVCHNDTSSGGFVSSTFMSNVHPGIISGCEGCHNGRFSTTSGKLNGKPANHLPVNQDCDVCHTNASFMAPTNFVHAGITGNCESCHDGKGSNVAAGALGKAQATNPHPATTADCGACHAIGNGFTDGTFDHTGIVDNCASCHGDNPTATPEGPRKNNGHVQTTEDCSICHVTGTFANAVFDHTGIVDNCSSCHDGVTATGATNTLIHQSTTEDCSVCHNTTAFAGARFDHTGITNNCDSCHDGATARGKTPPPNHVPTTGDCSNCHQTTGFIPGTFDHAGIVDNCRSCHDGAFAIGKSGSHVPTNQDCGICHTTTSFIGAGFNHTGIVNNCASCHDGATAPGKHNNHVATSLDCSSCHTTATFKGGSWTHDSSSAGNCDQCHSSGGGATAKPNGHLNTNEQCDVCHSTNGWAPTSFQHDRNGNYPGDHRNDPGCTGCHRGSIGGGIISSNYPDQLRYAPFCAGCHAGDFESEGDHIGGRNGTIEQNKNCGSSGCHRVTSSGF
jgi:hypothetical protein